MHSIAAVADAWMPSAASTVQGSKNVTPNAGNLQTGEGGRGGGAMPASLGAAG
jgi:hypothetical protein